MFTKFVSKLASKISVSVTTNNVRNRKGYERLKVSQTFSTVMDFNG